MNHKALFWGVAVFAFTAVLCIEGLAVTTATEPAWSSPTPTPLPSQIGAPLPGLSSSELTLFNNGRAHFLEVDVVANGLGPVFNSDSCANCHTIPAVGGGTFVTEVRAGKIRTDGTFDPLGGSLFQLFSIPDHQCQLQIPEAANVIGPRISLPTFGDGLVEAIPDQDITDYAADHKPYGIDGHAAIVYDLDQKTNRVGRFGWKAQQATLVSFAGDAYLNEMGITNRLFPNEVPAAVPCDTVPDPEDKPGADTLADIDHFANFMRFLAPPARAGNADDATIEQGEKIFDRIGCDVCHKPSYTTGANASSALNHKIVPLYSDLLLHDVGTGDGIPQAAATGNEFRTPPLWGLRLRRPLLHDGSALNISDAVHRHEGEAKTVVSNYYKLNSQQRKALLAFLNSL